MPSSGVVGVVGVVDKLTCKLSVLDSVLFLDLSPLTYSGANRSQKKGGKTLQIAPKC